MNALKKISFLIILLLLTPLGYSENASNNYKLKCMGCHGEEGELESDGMPRLAGFVGYFLNIKEGREYLIQVPGVANSPLNDAEISELLNYMINQFSGLSMPQTFKPFTEEEVSEYRIIQLVNVYERRNELISQLLTQKIISHSQ